MRTDRSYSPWRYVGRTIGNRYEFSRVASGGAIEYRAMASTWFWYGLGTP